ncbi:ATP-binding protein [Solihabitans fulvus]|uniref:ATP-binding protein n=1 Tax=Solihabitans fulvus TaxID=1892852 RepID=A0A5B2X5V5_9PSEU|nr:ATP-binding protein [Solihabitans fulvus]KAA2258624.1 ATP-binding protein [Solihabitans fulvus]
MLRSFRLGNHRSIWGEQELLLMPAYDKDRPALPVTAIYGANAAGKSNVLDGLRFMQRAVRESYGWEPGRGVPRQPFRLDSAATREPSTFVIEVQLEGIRYTYGFSVDGERVLEEWLLSYPHKRSRVIFERTLDEIKFGSTVPAQRGRTEILEELTRSNALFLSVAARTNFELALPVYEWFSSRLVFAEVSVRSNSFRRAAEFLVSEPGRTSEMVGLLRAADLGVRDLAVVEVDLFAGYSPEERRRIMQYAERGKEKNSEIRLVHGKSGVAFEPNEESAGTRVWLGLLPSVLAALADGSQLVVDEIDTSLHPGLTQRLVALFRSPSTNSGGAQLIFTTHDTTLLDPPLAEEGLGRDEVWFVNKDGRGATDLYPLTDFTPRKESNLERRYLSGRYGGVPEVDEQDFRSVLKNVDLVEAGNDGIA